MAEVTEQRPVGLAHLAAAALALGIVGFGDIDGDEAVLVAGQNRDVALRAVLVGDEVERQRVRVPPPWWRAAASNFSSV